MKKIVFIFSLVLIILLGFRSVQEVKNPELHYLEKGSQRSDTSNIKILLSQICDTYGDSFKYCQEIKDKKYNIVKSDSSNYVVTIG